MTLWALKPDIPSWMSGATKTVYVAADAEFPIDIRVEGATPVGTHWWRGSVDAPDPVATP